MKNQHSKRAIMGITAALMASAQAAASEPIGTALPTPGGAAQGDAPVLPGTIITTRSEASNIIGTPGQSPRLTSVGEALKWGAGTQQSPLEGGVWFSGDQQLTITVDGGGGRVALDLTSPSLDPEDYRSPSEYGDERYSNAPTATAFVLKSEDGKVIKQATFTPDDAKQAQVRFLEQDLPEGKYILSVHTTGKAKNSFALQATGATIHADRVNVNVLSKEWTTLLSLSPSPDKRTIKIYDTDGASELEMQLVFGPVATPVDGAQGDLDMIEVTIPAGEAAVLQARQPQTAKQHSNTIGIAVIGEVLTVSSPAPAPEAPAPKPPVPIAPAPLPPIEAAPAPAPEPEAPAEVIVEPPTIEIPQVEATLEFDQEPEPEPVAQISRNSEVVLEAISDTAISGRLILGWKPPAGSKIVLQSGEAGGPMVARSLDGKAVPVRRDAEGWYYFELPQHPAGQAGRQGVSLQLAHEGSLPAIDRPTMLSSSAGQLEVLKPQQQTWQQSEQAGREVQARSSWGEEAWSKALAGASSISAPRASTSGSDSISAEEQEASRDARRPTFQGIEDGQAFPGGTASFTVRYVGTEGAEADTTLTIDGETVSSERIGKRISGTDTQGRPFVEQSYIAVKLQPGKNILKAAGKEVTILAPKSASTVELTPESLVADGRTSNVINIRITDDAGVTVPLPSVTLEIQGAEPATPDASSQNGGYQLALQNGVGKLTLKPTTAAVLRISALDAQGQIAQGSKTFNLQTDRQPLIAATGSATARLGNLGSGKLQDAVTLAGRGSAIIPIGQPGPGMLGSLSGTLRLNADSEGIQTPTSPRAPSMLKEAATPSGHLTYGDGSSPNNDLPAAGKFSGAYDSAAFAAKYAAGAASDPLFGFSYSADAASAILRTPTQAGQTELSVSGYAARIGAQRLTIQAAGNQVTFKPEGGIARGTEELNVTGYMLDPLPGSGTGARTDRLIRGIDYTVDYISGTVSLTRPLRILRPSLRNPGNTDPSLTISYSPATGDATSKLAWGVSSRAAWGSLQSGASKLSGAEAPKSGASLLAGYAVTQAADGTEVQLIGARAQVAGMIGSMRGNLSLSGTRGASATSGGYLAEVKGDLSESSTTVAANGTQGLGKQPLPPVIGREARFGVSYQEAGYRGPSQGTPGISASARTTFRISERFGVKLAGDYRPVSSASAGSTLSNGSVAQKGNIELLGMWAPFATEEGSALRGLILSAGPGYSTELGVTGVGEVTLSRPQVAAEKGGFSAKVQLRHEQSISGAGYRTSGTVTTDIAGQPISFTVSRNVSGGSDPSQSTELSVEGNALGARYQLAYSFPASSSAPGQLTGSVDDLWQLTPKLSVGARVQVQSGGTSTIGGEVAYKGVDPSTQEGLDAALGVDLQRSSAGFGVGIRSRAAYTAGSWTIREDGKSVIGAASGHDYGFGAAYRGPTLALLSTIRGSSGALAPDPAGQLRAQVDVAWAAYRSHQVQLEADGTTRRTGLGLQGLDLRSGAQAYSTLGLQALNWQAYAGATAWLTERIGLGAVYRIAGQADVNGKLGSSLQQAVGLEATAVALPGLAFTLGYNFTPSGAFRPQDNLHPGAYLRLDALLGGMGRNGQSWPMGPTEAARLDKLPATTVQPASP